MPSAGIIVTLALAAIGYVYVGKPVARGLKHAAHGTCHVITLGKKCGKVGR
jgi:hypothetical protein